MRRRRGLDLGRVQRVPGRRMLAPLAAMCRACAVGDGTSNSAEHLKAGAIRNPLLNDNISCDELGVPPHPAVPSPGLAGRRRASDRSAPRRARAAGIARRRHARHNPILYSTTRLYVYRLYPCTGTGTSVSAHFDFRNTKASNVDLDARTY